MAAEWCDGFLQLVKGGQPIKGESINSEFTDAIEFQSFQFGSMSGFTDSDALYAAQDAGQRRSVAESRFGAENFGGFASLFGDDEQTVEMEEKDYKEFEGKDLANVDACNFQIVKQLDLASPNLFRAYCSTQDLEHREVFESATVSLKKATGGGARMVFLKYTFNDVVIVGYTLEVGKDGLPKETISLSFGKVRAEYKPQSKSGELGPSVQGGWDFIDRGPW